MQDWTAIASNTFQQDSGFHQISTQDRTAYILRAVFYSHCIGGFSIYNIMASIRSPLGTVPRGKRSRGCSSSHPLERLSNAKMQKSRTTSHFGKQKPGLQWQPVPNAAFVTANVGFKCPRKRQTPGMKGSCAKAETKDAGT